MSQVSANTTKCMAHGNNARAKIYEGQTMFYTAYKMEVDQRKMCEKGVS